MDVIDRSDLPFSEYLAEFQRLFSNDAACAAYFDKGPLKRRIHLPHCGRTGEPFCFANRSGILHKFAWHHGAS